MDLPGQNRIAKASVNRLTMRRTKRTVMKYLIGVSLLCLVCLTSHAQDDDDAPLGQDPGVRSKIQAARVAYITDQLALTPEEAEKFWPIYREYTNKRKALRKQLFLEEPGTDPAKTREENDKALVQRRLQMKQQELDLEKDYSARLLTVISAQKLSALPDAERRFRQMVIEQIQRRQQQRDRQQKKLQDGNN